MNTNTTPGRPPAAGSRYSKYYALRIRRLAGPEWRVFVAKGYDEAVTKAEHINGCLEVLKCHEITREQYLNAIENLKKGAVK